MSAISYFIEKNIHVIFFFKKKKRKFEGGVEKGTCQSRALALSIRGLALNFSYKIRTTFRIIVPSCNIRKPSTTNIVQEWLHVVEVKNEGLGMYSRKFFYNELTYLCLREDFGWNIRLFLVVCQQTLVTMPSQASYTQQRRLGMCSSDLLHSSGIKTLVPITIIINIWPTKIW